MGETAARFQVSPDVVTRDIDGGLMLLNLQTGTTWKLNKVGAAVCRRLDGATDLAGIVAELDREYGVGLATLRRDIDALLDALQEQGLVEPVPAG
jgi:hypothetical protein